MLAFAASGFFNPVRDACERLRALHQRHDLGRMCLQLVERELYRAGQEPHGYSPGVLAQTHEAGLRAAAPELFSAGSTPQLGQLVLSAIVAPDEPWLLGLHRHRRGRCRTVGPGGGDRHGDR